MGLIRLAKIGADAIGSTLGDQWLEYFYCDSIDSDTLMVKGQKKVNDGHNYNTKGMQDNIISNGSVIAVNEGQCMMIVDNGKIVDICAEAGEFKYDNSTEPSIFAGNFLQSLGQTAVTAWRRFTFGGNAGKDQRVYYFNTKEIMNNLYGTATPIPFRVVDNKIGLDLDTELKCNGKYSFHIADPVVFYTKVCGNVKDSYNKSELTSFMKDEMITALQPALGELSAQGIRYSELPRSTKELVNALNTELSEQWMAARGIEMVSITFNPSLPKDVSEMIRARQNEAVYKDPNMAAAGIAAAQMEAMKSAASNTSTGPMMAFAGMNMAQMAGGMNAGNLFAMGQQQQQASPAQTAPAQAAPAAPAGGAAEPILGWTCSCGKADNRGKFCVECGSPKPAEAGWTCSCGQVNQGKFCCNCGKKKPEGAPLYKCDKCGWEPEDPTHPPKFCPECGDVFDENDIQ